MSRKLIRPRRLVLDADTVYMWTVRHRHSAEGGRPYNCRTVLCLRREGTTPRLEIAFRETGEPSGPGQRLNLHEPGIVRRFVDEALARGLLPAPPGTTEVDGGPLFDAVIAASAAARGGRPDHAAPSG
ncbi:hypothetical protein [Streptomyces sp. NPDC001985]|uniref:hypothetical protein n=1 Tax=Streptomyces sp. NPDC001985 TaxID=3154406 RepID=UPI00332A3017